MDFNYNDVCNIFRLLAGGGLVVALFLGLAACRSGKGRQ